MTNLIPANVIAGKPFSEWELTIKDTFNLQEFYKRIHKFLVVESWHDLKGKDVDGGGSEFEDYFFQRKENGMQFNTIWWRATKRPDFHGNKYFQFYLTLDIAIVAMKDTEVMHNGKKVKAQNGEMRINARFFLSEQDKAAGSRGQEWNDSPLLKFAKNMGFWKRENPEIRKRCEAELMKFSNDMYQLIQAYTGVAQETVTQDFFPVRGLQN